MNIKADKSAINLKETVVTCNQPLLLDLIRKFKNKRRIN